MCKDHCSRLCKVDGGAWGRAIVLGKEQLQYPRPGVGRAQLGAVQLRGSEDVRVA